MRVALLIGAWALSLGAHAQPAKIPRVAILQNGSLATAGHLTDAFLRGMTEHGYLDGRNVVYEVRYADAQLDRIPKLAQELAALNPNVIFAPSAFAAGAAKNAGVSLPIVFAVAPDPVAQGFAASLSRPGGNMTGLTSLSPEMGAKRIELLREALPKLSRLAVLHIGSLPGVPAQLAEAQRAMKLIGKEFVALDVRRLEDVEPAFAEIVRVRADALLVIENPLFFNNRSLIVRLADKHRLPAVYISKEYVLAGGLMSYGSNYVDLNRRAASHVDKILKGAKPGDLPIEQPVSFELVINLRTAKALGLAMPRELLLRADQVVD